MYFKETYFIKKNNNDILICITKIENLKFKIDYVENEFNGQFI